jgi:ribosomal protein L32
MSKHGKKDRRIFKGRHAGRVKEEGSSDGKHKDPQPAHAPDKCPKNAASASSSRGKQGLTHHVCTDCGTTWSE